MISCTPFIKLVFNVRDVKYIESRLESDSLNGKLLNKFDVDYIMLYRTDFYIKKTNDTSLWNGKVKYFSPDRVMYIQHTNYCPTSTTRDIHPDSLYLMVKENENDTVETIDKYLVGLEYSSGRAFVIDSVKLKKYNVVMDFNTWWIGPEKKHLKRIVKALPKDSTLYLFINKDYIVSDSLEFYKYLIERNKSK